MKRFLTQTLRSGWLVVCLHVGIWVLIYLAAANLGGKAPDLHESDSFSTPPSRLPPVAKLSHLFATGVWPKSVLETNAVDPFFTRHFIPPPPPSPPAPTTRKIDLTYQGFFQTADAPKQTILKMGDVFLITPLGAKVTANLFVSDVTAQTLTLTNLSNQTNVLTLNTKKEIEVPIQ
jgi:hypothetical protein